MDVLDWRHEPHEIAERALVVERDATAGELTAIAAALDLIECSRLSVVYRIERRGADRYRMSGLLDAEVTQACVVTLDPVEARHTEKFTIDLEPPKVAESDVEFDALADDQSEPLDPGSAIPAGRLVYEHLAAILDPYPRKAGAELDWRDEAGEAATRAASPFAVLGRLKPEGTG